MTDTALSRGEIDCFCCQMRMLEKDSRRARLAHPKGLYEDGVEICLCNKPACNTMGDALDAKYGKPGT